jgi:hypothetical protein
VVNMSLKITHDGEHEYMGEPPTRVVSLLPTIRIEVIYPDPDANFEIGSLEEVSYPAGISGAAGTTKMRVIAWDRETRKLLLEEAPAVYTIPATPLGVTSDGVIVGVAGAQQPRTTPINAPTKPGFYWARMATDEWEPVSVVLVEPYDTAISDPGELRVVMFGDESTYGLDDFAEFGAELVR